MKNIIETNSIVKVYNGKTVLDHVSLHVGEGTIYGFVGENGSGKTTIMRILMGLATQNEGEYSLFGVDSKDNAIYSVRKNISSIVETPSLVPTMTATENLKFACMYYGIKDYSIIDEVLKSVGLIDTGKKKVKNFSLGMRQRLGIAILLLNKPKLMLLDEPMNGLDPEGIAELRDLIINLNKQGITFLISSHILSELEKIATHYGFICKGKLIKEISANDLVNEFKKSVEVKYDDISKLEKALSKLKIKDYKVNPTSIIIYDDVKPIDLLNKLAKENIDITDIKTIDLSVEDYYLSLVKGGGLSD